MQKKIDNKIIILKGQLEDIKGKLEAERNAHRHTKEKHNIFKDRLANLYGSAHSDESILKFATGNTNAMDDRDKYKDLWEREVEAHKEDIKKHKEELEKFKQEIAQMRREKLEREKQAQVDSEVFDKRIDTIEDKINNSVEKKEEAEKIISEVAISVKVGWLEKIKTLFKKEKHD